MPLFEINREDKGILAIWKVSETNEELLSILPNRTFHEEYISRFKTEKRKLEYLAVRALVYRVLGEGYIISYLSSGKPVLQNGNGFISISHTDGYVAVIYSKEFVCGIDIEKYSDKVLNVKSRIVGPSEKADNTYTCLLHWSAKETAFKILDMKGVDFIKNFRVDSLSSCKALYPHKTDTKGFLSLLYNFGNGIQGNLNVNYVTTADYVLTYSYKDNI